MSSSRPPGARRRALRRRPAPPGAPGTDTAPLGGRPATRPLPPVAPLPLPPRKPTVTRVAAARTRELTGAAVRRVQTASRADGAAESGL
ncbi:MAG TPA: MFS transporter, partial [Geodermatophilus sp.]|nr:MFS transporter [Geodermatophilus sp.]